jgi:predicted acylesterase/phospholipase RssA
MKANKATRTKIAIACQGGGSQTAFTAGVLSSFFENKVHLKKQIVGLSGTSGGAVCASLAWFGLLKAAQGDANTRVWLAELSKQLGRRLRRPNKHELGKGLRRHGNHE